MRTVFFVSACVQFTVEDDAVREEGTWHEGAGGGGRGLGLWRQSELGVSRALPDELTHQRVLLQVSSMTHLSFLEDVAVEVRERRSLCKRRWPLLSGLQDEGTASPVGGVSLGQGSKACVTLVLILYAAPSCWLRVGGQQLQTLWPRAATTQRRARPPTPVPPVTPPISTPHVQRGDSNQIA